MTMQLSNRKPASGLKFRNKLSGAIKSYLPRSEGRCAYDAGWDDPQDSEPTTPIARSGKEKVHVRIQSLFSLGLAHIVVQLS